MSYAIFAIVVLVLALVERQPRLRFEALPFFRRFFGTDLTCLLTGGILLSGALQSWAAGYAGMLLPAGADPASLPGWLLFPVAVILYDLGGYVAHVLLHRVDALWEFHKVHHSSRTLDWLATFRAHIVEHALRHLISPVALLLAGFPPAVVGVAGAIYAAWASFGHANLALNPGRLEALFITPGLHRLHHVPVSSEKNFGTILSLWDRAAGTLHTDPDARLSPIGVPGEIDLYPQRWLGLFLEPFRRGPIAAARNRSVRYPSSQP